MISFTPRLRSLTPNMHFTFRKEDFLFVRDKDEKYGFVEGANIIVNQDSPDYFEMRVNRINDNDNDAPLDIYGNQISYTEINSTNDVALSIGTNGHNSNVYYLNSYNGYTQDLEHELRLDRLHSYVWQMQFNLNEVKNDIVNKLEKVKVVKEVDFVKNEDDYIVVLEDLEMPTYSYSICKDMYSDGNTNIDYWSGDINPPLIVENDLGLEDERPIRIILMNPHTKEIFDSVEFNFKRNKIIDFYDNIVQYENTVINVFRNRSVLDNPNKLIYNITPHDKNNIRNKPRIKNIIYDYSRSNNFKVALIEGSTIPAIENVTVEVENTKIIDRKEELLEIKPNNTQNLTSQIMQFMDLTFHVGFDDNLYIGSIYRKGFIKQLSLNNSTKIDKDGNTRLLVTCNCYYSSLEYDEDTKIWSFVKTYSMFINNEYMQVIGIGYTGKESFINYRGIGEKFLGIPTFDNMPIVLGGMAKSFVEKERKKYKVEYEFFDLNLDYIDKINWGLPFNEYFIDNFAYSENVDFNSHHYDLYIRTFIHKDSGLEKDLVNYWACDSIRNNMRDIPNKFNYSSMYYDVYSDIRIRGEGYFEHETNQNHNKIKDSILFNNVTGNANLLNTWSQNGMYTINFWFKSNQKTKGVIMTDMMNQSNIVKGVYIGISDGGYLEVAVNSYNTRIYNTIINEYDIDITDGNWHMITLIYNKHRYSNIYIDNEHIDSFIDGVITNDYNKSFADSLNVYFMGHPRGKNTIGSLSKIAFYKNTLSLIEIKMLYDGDIEHFISGRVYLQNMPYETEVRIYNNDSGELMLIVYSDVETGKFLYKNYNNSNVYIITMDFKNRFGNMQVVGPVEPRGFIGIEV